MSTPNMWIGYFLWIFGFTGSHRFYFGKPLTGTLYFFTLGLLGVGWLVDLFLIPDLSRKAQVRFGPGPYNYNLAWLFLTFLGMFGVHRFYLSKWLSGLVYFLTGGVFLLGYIFDLWTLNTQVDSLNRVGARTDG